MKVTPIQIHDLEAVGRFLHAHLNPRITAEAWSASLRHRWAASVPNHGMQLLDDDGARVGVMLAVYSDQQIDGKVEAFCNPHSWCVLPDYRHASIQLVLALLRQRGYHFTMYTPNPKVTQVFSGLRFRLLDDALLHLPNLPRPWRHRAGERTEGRPEAIGALLQGAARDDFEAHRGLPWLQFAAFGVEGDTCLAIYKRGHWKRMGCARLLHLSDSAALHRHGHLLHAHLWRQGMPFSVIEARFLDPVPMLALRGRRGQPKLALTALPDASVRDVYSELMALDI